MNINTLRRHALTLLDDENGISKETYESLRAVADEADLLGELQDIWDLVDATDGQFYIGEDEAEELRQAMAS